MRMCCVVIGCSVHHPHPGEKTTRRIPNTGAEYPSHRTEPPNSERRSTTNGGTRAERPPRAGRRNHPPTAAPYSVCPSRPHLRSALRTWRIARLPMRAPDCRLPSIPNSVRAVRLTGPSAEAPPTRNTPTRPDPRRRRATHVRTHPFSLIRAGSSGSRGEVSRRTRLRCWGDLG